MSKILSASATMEQVQEKLAAQQAPVACQYAKDVAMPEYRCVGRCQYDTSPPAQRPWVGLTDEEFESIEKATLNVHGIPKYFGTAIEAALRSKNEDRH